MSPKILITVCFVFIIIRHLTIMMCYLKVGGHLLIKNNTLKLPTATNLTPFVKTYSTEFSRQQREKLWDYENVSE